MVYHLKTRISVSLYNSMHTSLPESWLQQIRTRCSTVRHLVVRTNALTPEPLEDKLLWKLEPERFPRVCLQSCFYKVTG